MSVRKVKGGYKVYSEAGKPLSKTYKTKTEADDRLKVIERVKHAKKKRTG